tara:strand:- start:45099 stop:45398 length:300 start_codon:yes stop_codon:yes gene_type:complete
MSKLSIQYTNEQGVVFSIDAEYDQFKAGRSDKNDGKLINIPDMTAEEAWKLNPVEQTILSVVMHTASSIGAFDPRAANATDSINNKTYLNQDKKDEDFI